MCLFELISKDAPRLTVCYNSSAIWRLKFEESKLGSLAAGLVQKQFLITQTVGSLSRVLRFKTASLLSRALNSTSSATKHTLNFCVCMKTENLKARNDEFDRPIREQLIEPSTSGWRIHLSAFIVLPESRFVGLAADCNPLKFVWLCWQYLLERIRINFGGRAFQASAPMTQMESFDKRSINRKSVEQKHKAAKWG